MQPEVNINIVYLGQRRTKPKPGFSQSFDLMEFRFLTTITFELRRHLIEFFYIDDAFYNNDTEIMRAK